MFRNQRYNRAYRAPFKMVVGLIFFSILSTNSFAQLLGNEWITYSQTYYKLPITQTGIYRIDSTALANSGINVSLFDARNLQMFFHGSEIPIYVEGENDGVLNGTDFIEFHGVGNDGWFDTALYISGAVDQINPAYSIFNDTSFYYITWNSSTSNLRFQLETDTAFSGYTVSNYYMYKAQHGLTADYYEGELIGSSLIPEYTDGEGYCEIFSGPNTYDANWTDPALNGFQSTLYTGGGSPNSEVTVHVATCNNPTSGDDHHHQITVGGILRLDTTLNAYQFYQRGFSVSTSDLTSPNPAVTVDFLGDLDPITRNALGYYEVYMPQTFDLGNRSEQYMDLPDATAQSKARMDITNFNDLGSNVWIHDLTNNRKVLVADNGATHRALVPNSGGIKQLYISSESSVNNISAVYPVSTDASHFAQFRDFQSTLTDRDYIIITHKHLMTEAATYENYRSTLSPDTLYSTLLVDVEELYDQFGFGISKHPVSIRNFLKMTNTFWSSKPGQVFLIGKGVKHEFFRNNNSNYNLSLLPVIGNPPCDNLFTLDIDGTGNQYCGIGRISVNNGGEVTDYLNKVQDYENNHSNMEEWMKHALHLAGGSEFVSPLQTFQQVYEDTLFGGQVFPFQTVGTAPFPISATDSLIYLAETEGISLATFFGHSSGTQINLLWNDPEDMTNFGKPFWVIVNGCLSGDIYQTSPLLSERFVLEPQKAAIGFIASTSLGYQGTLTSITYDFYRNFCVDDYRLPMGTAHKNAVQENTPGPYYALLRMNALDYQLHGDPGLLFNADPLPDLEVTVDDISFNPTAITSELDSFDIEVVVTNLGRAVGSSYGVNITRDFPGTAPDTTYNITRPNIYFKDTIRLTLPVDKVNGFGQNCFTVEVDPAPFPIVESDESNNTATKCVNIITADLIPVYPYKYAVIPQNQTLLKASTGDPFAPLKTYKFQIDTTDLFNSPFMMETIIADSGGVIEWNPGALLGGLPGVDSAVYFWRTGVDSANTGVFHKWRESTFQYIDGRYGWGQDHFFQFKDDEYLYIDDNRSNRTFEFVPNFQNLKVITYPSPNPASDPFNALTLYSLNSSVQESSGCIQWPVYSAFYVFVIDPVTLEPWESHCPSDNNDPSMSFGNFNDNCGCRSRSEKLFMYTNLADPTQRDGFNSLMDAIPNGYYVGGYSFWSPNFSNASYWNDSIINTLEEMGCENVRALRDSAFDYPYIFYSIKGDTTSTQEVVGTDGTTPIQLNVPLQNQWYFGTIKSELVGPASEWKSFHWDAYSIDTIPSNDSVWVSIYGVTVTGQEQQLSTYTQIPLTTSDIYTLNSIPASTYPFLKLYMYTRDDSTVTPSQLNRWHVMYEGIPECALSPNVHYYFNGDTLYEGENLNFSVAIENIGDYDFDSLEIRYSIIDANNVSHDYFVTRDSLLVGQTLLDTFTVSTSGYGGARSFLIEANPYTANWQLEQYHFNNIAIRDLGITSDRINPLLDVTFDGIHIMDGDIVSAKPYIVLQLKDENQFSLMNDTSDFDLFIKYPSQAIPTKINFSDPNVVFIPATSPDNYAKVEIDADFTSEDGIYELLARATDIAGNESGEGDGNYDYKIRFEVINQSTITNIFNFPNPFSTSTQWVFTLTGSEVPTEFLIRIMTISGVVVREITLDELGPIHIGNNVTEYRWDGRDEFGDKLATGVYIYQVTTKINGEVIDHRSTSADKYFKNNYGKLYIIN